MHLIFGKKFQNHKKKFSKNFQIYLNHKITSIIIYFDVQIKIHSTNLLKIDFCYSTHKF